MKPNPDLWCRLQAFDFDSEGHDGRFLSKLARDNGWRIPHARRVVEEYRRYAFLCCTAGHMVVPSEQVDQAWHQHLLDTQPYWEIFCRQVLGRPLHHRPSSGSLDDRRRHIEMYERTLASYAETFGHAPPADIWPPASRRFGSDLRHRRARLADYWLIPRRPVLRGTAVIAGVAATAALVGAGPRYVGLAGPLDFDGPTFLLFYVVLLAAALAASLVLRWRLLEPARHPAPGPFGRGAGDDLDPYEAATLQTNTRRAINAAMAALQHEGALRITEHRERGFFRKGHYRVARSGPLPEGALPLEAAVYEEVGRDERGMPLSRVHGCLGAPAAALVASLQERGLLLGPGTAGQRLLVAIPLLALAGLGLVKVGVGVWRDRPVEWLVILVALTALVVGQIIASMRRTRRGSAALRAARRHRPRRRVRSAGDVASGRDLAWLVGLYGIVILHGGELGVVHAAVTADAARGGGAGSASSGGCGGGCSGGGGGCGGGCGGCGG